MKKSNSATISDGDWEPDEWEFARAVHEYRQKAGKVFLSCREHLQVLRSLGYAKTAKGPEVRSDWTSQGGGQGGDPPAGPGPFDCALL